MQQILNRQSQYYGLGLHVAQVTFCIVFLFEISFWASVRLLAHDSRIFFTDNGNYESVYVDIQRGGPSENAGGSGGHVLHHCEVRPSGWNLPVVVHHQRFRLSVSCNVFFSFFLFFLSDKHTAVDKLVFLDILATVLGDADIVITTKLLTYLLHPLTRDAQVMGWDCLYLLQSSKVFSFLSSAHQSERIWLGEGSSATNSQGSGAVHQQCEFNEGNMRHPVIFRHGSNGLDFYPHQYFISQLVFETSESEETRHSILEILLELFNISPQLVASALKHLEHHVGVRRDGLLTRSSTGRRSCFSHCFSSRIS